MLECTVPKVARNRHFCGVPSLRRFCAGAPRVLVLRVVGLYCNDCALSDVNGIFWAKENFHRQRFRLGFKFYAIVFQAKLGTIRYGDQGFAAEILSVSLKHRTPKCPVGFFCWKKSEFQKARNKTMPNERSETKKRNTQECETYSRY